MSIAEEYFGADPFDPLDDDGPWDEQETVHCKQCGKDGLYWSNHVDGWRLETLAGTPHDCKNVNFRAATSGFESIE